MSGLEPHPTHAARHDDDDDDDTCCFFLDKRQDVNGLTSNTDGWDRNQGHRSMKVEENGKKMHRIKLTGVW
jgi:hypothetical protein